MPLKSRHLMPEGLAFALRSIGNNRNVKSANVEHQEFYNAIVTINRKKLYPNIIKAYIADVYILTASDVNEILDNYPNVNCIVVISNWNQYTGMAKQEARNNGVGVFTITEFREALNLSGDEFLDTGNAIGIE